MTERALCTQCGENKVKPRYKRCARCRGREFNLCACGEQKTIRARSCLACSRLRRGPEHGCWRGGRVALRDGYVRVWAPEHPRATNGRYVLEHTLVMENILGRHLLPDENVHHINGQRADNRPENLELWSHAQPCGQRVEDKVAWMKDFIARYEVGAAL